jgi:hypothetical protein
MWVSLMNFRFLRPQVCDELVDRYRELETTHDPSADSLTVATKVRLEYILVPGILLPRLRVYHRE